MVTGKDLSRKVTLQPRQKLNEEAGHVSWGEGRSGEAERLFSGESLK